MNVVLVTCVMVIFSALANVLLKLDAMLTTPEFRMFGLWGWRTLAGTASFGVALVAYTMLLCRLPLHVAQSLAALQFIGVILASWFVLGEEISLSRALGVLIIVLGITIIAMSYR